MGGQRLRAHWSPTVLQGTLGIGSASSLGNRGVAVSGGYPVGRTGRANWSRVESGTRFQRESGLRDKEGDPGNERHGDCPNEDQ